jgi:hypothetical protein
MSCLSSESIEQGLTPIQLLTYLPQYTGGVAPIANGLLHQHPDIKEDALTILLVMAQYPVSLFC